VQSLHASYNRIERLRPQEHGLETTISSTHEITMRSAVVIKRFRSWDRGEQLREWTGLTLLAAHTPDLAPVPVDADLAGDPPTVTMSRLAAEPLGRSPLTRLQTEAVAAAVTRLHRAIPAYELDRLPPRIGEPAALASQVRAWTDQQTPTADPLVVRAFDAGSAWIRLLPQHVLADDVPPVFGHADGNLANYLWDGTRIRMVDFEDSGRSDRAFEVAELVEHLSAWIEGAVDVPLLIAMFDLTLAERTRLRELRRLCAFLWLLMLLPDGPAHERNPAGTARRQAERLLALLG
jgi:Ser/Thr protein kinase RdoA (MazF antagonist)